ncbi:zinc-binding dehydrogenase [Pseudotabrizicola sp. L79]|uniref:zinc-binding dehydrogenase n=1 Tax=Pseudotabrizicola sp. L79 TaxID=3118402 RepID=UPI002F95F998
MWAVVTTGTGGYDRLSWREVPRPVPGPGEVLVQVLAAGVNNTDINTRLGWYAPEVTDGTAETSDTAADAAGGWDGATPFPLIQGTDCCGRVVGAGAGVDAGLIGQRVLVRPCMDDPVTGASGGRWLGSNLDGAFAQFVKVPAGEVFALRSGWSDAELASVPCAYGTAENMLHRAGVAAGMRVLVPGASGGVGSAVVQLAKRRGAEVVAVTTAAKAAALRDLGADRVLERADDPVQALGAQSVDVVVDTVGGPGFGGLLTVLRRGGCYVTSGAIAGPVVRLDLRVMYLNDLRLIGCTAWAPQVFADLIGYVERQEIRPLVAATLALPQIAEAQRLFQEKRHLGKIVLLPPP